MKYIITERQYRLLEGESRILTHLKKYLNDIDWIVYTPSNSGATRLYINGNDKSSDEQMFQVDTSPYEKNKPKRLLVKYALVYKLESLFGMSQEELSPILIDWFNEYTGDNTEELEIIGNEIYNHRTTV